MRIAAQQRVIDVTHAADRGGGRYGVTPDGVQRFDAVRQGIDPGRGGHLTRQVERQCWIVDDQSRRALRVAESDFSWRRLVLRSWQVVQYVPLRADL